MNILIELTICLYLLMPIAAHAAGRSPLDYPLSQYVLMLGIAILGGVVSWVAKVRDGRAQAWNIMHLIGEICTSAFAGLLAFWVCEHFGVDPLLTAASVGIAGHMGARAISAGEEFARRKFSMEPERRRK